MASTNFTTHYSIPTPLGTDLTTPMDYNEAAEAVDTALFGAVTDAGNASEAAAAAVTTANAAADAVDTIAGDLSQEKAKIVALQTRVTNAENEIDDVRADSSDMITAYNEPTATASHRYEIGDFFIYNNTLYKATATIVIGATIVPDTNCETTNVSTELIEIKSALFVNTFDSPIDISSYTDQNSPYEVPKDGYIDISTTTTVGTISVIVMSPSTTSNRMTSYVSCLIAGTAARSNIFVKKGMRVYFTVSDTSINAANFRGLS